MSRIGKDDLPDVEEVLQDRLVVRQTLENGGKWIGDEETRDEFDCGSQARSQRTPRIVGAVNHSRSSAEAPRRLDAYSNAKTCR